MTQRTSPLVGRPTAFEDVVEKETHPRRLASLRAVTRGREELRQGRYERAAREFTGAIEIDSGNPSAYFYLGIARFETRRFEESVELFEKASTLSTQDVSWKAESLAFQGESLEKLGRWKEAQNAFRFALQFQKENARARVGLERVKDHL